MRAPSLYLYKPNDAFFFAPPSREQEAQGKRIRREAQPAHWFATVSCVYMLLRALALVVGASASAEINCTFAPNECPGVSWDLTPLQQLTRSADLEVAAAAGEVPDEHFWLGVCRSPIEAGQCETLSNISDPAGLQVWRSEAGGEECAPLGSLSTAAWSMASPGNEAEGVLLSFSGGAAGRSMVVRFVCDKSIPKARVLR